MRPSDESGQSGDLCVWENGSSKVNVDGDATVRFTDPIATNGDSANAYGAQISPSQTTVNVNS